MIYGYARVSTEKQNIDRQERNILRDYPSAVIIKEYYTGTTTEGRSEWQKLYRKILRDLEAGEDVTVVFDSVSRMSRDAKEGFELYKEMYSKNINLVFINEPHINTDVYSSTIKTAVPLTGGDVDVLLKAINEYLMILAEKHIFLAFEQAEKEVRDLKQRTREGIETARRNGKTIGHKPGSTYVTKKELEARQIILKKSNAFGGHNTDKEVMKLAGIAQNTYYKYKANLKAELIAAEAARNNEKVNYSDFYKSE